jgi:hypothetical protein
MRERTNMRSLLITVVLATVALTVSLPTARAQTSISLGASTKSLVFSTTKYSRSLDLNLGTLCPGSTNFCRASGMGDKGPLASEFKSHDGLLDLNLQSNEDLSGLIELPSVFNRTGGGWWKREYRHHTPYTPISGGSPSVDPTPEPSSIVLFGSGLLALTGILRRRRAHPPRDMST